MTTNWIGRAAMALGMMISLSAPALAQDFNDMSAADLERGITQFHPAAYYVLAGKLFQDGEKDKAVFWFYAGQLRYRAHLSCHPDIDPSGDPALFGSLSEVLGRPINEYAFGDIPALAKIMDEVLVWDEANANGFMSKDECAAALADTRAGLADLGKTILAQEADIRAQREANGLANR